MNNKKTGIWRNVHPVTSSVLHPFLISELTVTKKNRSWVGETAKTALPRHLMKLSKPSHFSSVFEQHSDQQVSTRSVFVLLNMVSRNGPFSKVIADYRWTFTWNVSTSPEGVVMPPGLLISILTKQPGGKAEWTYYGMVVDAVRQPLVEGADYRHAFEQFVHLTLHEPDNPGGKGFLVTFRAQKFRPECAHFDVCSGGYNPAEIKKMPWPSDFNSHKRPPLMKMKDAQDVQLQWEEMMGFVRTGSSLCIVRMWCTLHPLKTEVYTSVF